jgi:fucose permease
MPIKTNHTHTLYASYIGYITQAIVNNFAPLLFLTFQTAYDIPFNRIAQLVMLNFAVQLLVDLLSIRYADKLGYRRLIIAAHIFAAAGLAGLGIFPSLFPTPYAGLVAAVVVYAIGGGIIEVLISPIVEACPTEKKEAAMSLLHSFYCWGHVFVVLCSTLFFALFGLNYWKSLALIWAVIPLCNAFYFLLVPIATLAEKHETMSVRHLLSGKTLWLFVLLMVCAGASEQAMSQWASAFAEAGINVSKTVGDLAGPCMFAALMGASRVFYAKYSEKIPLRAFMAGSGILSISGYLLAALTPYPAFALAGCGICGLAAGILWPGTFSLASARIPTGGTAMFALLALAGDLGCSLGPGLVGVVSETAGSNLKSGLAAAVVFPVLLVFIIFILSFLKKKSFNGAN